MSKSWKEATICGDFVQVGDPTAERLLLRVLRPGESVANSGANLIGKKFSLFLTYCVTRCSYGCKQALKFLNQVAIGPAPSMLFPLNAMTKAHYTTDKWQVCDLRITIRAIFMTFYNFSSANAALWLLAASPVSDHGREHRGLWSPSRMKR